MNVRSKDVLIQRSLAKLICINYVHASDIADNKYMSEFLTYFILDILLEQDAGLDVYDSIPMNNKRYILEQRVLRELITYSLKTRDDSMLYTDQFIYKYDSCIAFFWY